MGTERQLTIGEFARRTGLSISALRFYDRVGVIVPADIDPQSAYRRYDEVQVEEAILVRDLRRLELPLAAIHEFLAADPAERLAAVDAHLDHLSSRLHHARSVAHDLRFRIANPEGPTAMSTMLVDAHALAEAIDQVTPASSTDPELPLLQTVLVEARDGTLRLVATDRYRLAVRDLVSRGGDHEAFRTVVATAGLQRIRKTLDGRPDDATVEVAHHEHWLVIGADRDDPAARIAVMPAEFPPYEKLFVLDPDSASAVVDRASLAALLEAVGDADVVRVTIGDGRLVLEDDPQRSVPSSYGGPLVTVGLHPAFLRYAVGAAVGPEVMIEVTEPVKPVVLRSATDSSYVCMVMPIKLAA